VAGKDDEAPRDRLLFSLMLGTGIRLGSAIELDVRDLDLEEGRIVLRRTKGGGADSLFVNRSLAAELRAFLGKRTSGPLFLAAGERRTSARQVQRRFSQWIEKSGTRMARNGVPLAVAQRMLGHGTVALTAQVYTQLETEDLREAVESLPALRVARDG
jgi:integrase/recombinase XerD